MDIEIPESSDNPRDYDRGGNPTEDLQKAASLIEEIREGGRHSLVPDYADVWDEDNQVNPEIIFSIQYNQVEGLNGNDASPYKNQLHEFWGNQYDNQAPGMARVLNYGRPFRRLFLTDYAVNISDRYNDSRLRKSMLEVYYCTEVLEANIPKWTAEELLFAFEDVAADGSWAIRYGDTIRAGDLKFAYASVIPDSKLVNVGDTALVFLINDENTTLTDRQMVGAGYRIYARYYWATDENRNPTELITYDRDDDLLSISPRYVNGSETIESFTWDRNHSPSLLKYMDTHKFDVANHWGTRDVFLARLAESYLIAAEAYGRLGDYNKAAEFINLVRTRAAYKEGEEKGQYWRMYDHGTDADYTASTVDAMQITSGYWDDASHNEEEMYPPSVDSKEERFIAYILNERCRELLGEMVRWEDLVRTGTLVERTTEFNDDTRNSGTIQKFHRIRPIPQIHLDAIKVDGRYLTAAEKQEYQNEGYH
ncbi:MAG: RagB/SusD family nutrient uptake outer membrane protein [Bacteroidales bacterium]